MSISDYHIILLCLATFALDVTILTRVVVLPRTAVLMLSIYQIHMKSTSRNPVENNECDNSDVCNPTYSTKPKVAGIFSVQLFTYVSFYINF